MNDAAMTPVGSAAAVPHLPMAARAQAREAHLERVRATIGTRPVVYLIASMPLLWVLGGERLLSPVVIVATVVVLALNYRPARRGVPAAIGWGIVFVVADLLSGFQVIGAGRVATFVWDLSLYVAFFTLALAIYRFARTPGDIRSVLTAAVGILLFSHALTVYFLLVGPIEFTTLAGSLLPAEVRNTPTGQMVAVHSVGRDLFFFGLSNRVSGIFGPSIHLGAAILLSLPMIYVRCMDGRRLARLFWLAVLVLSLVILTYSQARTAIVITGLLLPSLVFAGWLFNTRVASPRLLLPLLAMGVILILFAGLQVLPAVSEPAREFFIEARASSASTRFEIYRQTVDAIPDNPLLGHGTQRDVSDLLYPLGSHSWYLALLYKHGLLGFLPFLAFVFTTHMAGFRAVGRFAGDRANRRMAIAIVAGLVAHALLALTVEPIVSALHLYLLAVLVGSALAMRRMHPEPKVVPAVRSRRRLG
jgi:O-antigen ligase